MEAPWPSLPEELSHPFQPQAATGTTPLTTSASTRAWATTPPLTPWWPRRARGGADPARRRLPPRRARLPAFKRVLREGPSSPETGWFRLNWPPGAGPGTVPVHATFEGHDAPVALDHADLRVAEYVVAVMTHWTASGADGWRRNAA